MSGASRKSVLIVDDTPTNVAVVSGVLKDLYKTKVATNGEKALALAAGPQKPDLILLDVTMPGMDGYEVCRNFKANPETTDIPVIFLTARTRFHRRGEGFPSRRRRLHPQAVLGPNCLGKGQNATGIAEGS